MHRVRGSSCRAEGIAFPDCAWGRFGQRAHYLSNISRIFCRRSFGETGFEIYTLLQNRVTKAPAQPFLSAVCGSLSGHPLKPEGAVRREAQGEDV